jgi:predicted sulfurtransferase
MIAEQRSSTCYGTVRYQYGLDIREKTGYWYIAHGVYIFHENLNELLLEQTTLTVQARNVFEAELGACEVGLEVVPDDQASR